MTTKTKIETTLDEIHDAVRDEALRGAGRGWLLVVAGIGLTEKEGPDIRAELWRDDAAPARGRAGDLIDVWTISRRALFASRGSARRLDKMADEVC